MKIIVGEKKMLLLKQLIIILIASSFSLVSAGIEESYLSSEQQREVEIDDLIKTLEERMKANRASSAESNVVTNSWDHERDLRGAEGQQQIINEPVQVSIKPLDGQNDKEADSRDKRKAAVQTSSQAKQPKKSTAKKPISPSPKIQRSPPSDFEKDEAYYKSLLRLQNLYRLYNKRYLDDRPLAEDRPSRHCGGGDHVARKLDRIATSRVRYLEKSRLLADRIAEAAMHMARKKGRIMDCLHSACGCGRNRLDYDEPIIISEAEPAVVADVVQPLVVVEEPSKRRDVEVAAASSSATQLSASVDAGGASVDAASATSVASATNIDTGLGGASISAASEVASDVHVGTSIGGAGISAGISTESQLNLGHKHAGLWTQLSSCDNYERRMIMDMAIEEAADMIRKLTHETRAELSRADDPAFERRILGMAINLVNKVTAGATGDRLDVFGDLRYNNVDDYLKASIAEGEIESDYVSNAGFDYAGTGRHLYDGPMDGMDDYAGYASPFSRGRCDSCAKYDITLGNACPLCKRSGHIFQGRIKRNDAQPDKAKIYHLEQLPQVQSKKYKSGGVWEDVNKLYNFDDLENEKFIDLSLNCTRDPENLNCQRLQFNLVVPKDADPVPLWFVRDNLSQGRSLAADMHERADKLQRPKKHSASMLHYLGNRVPLIARQLNKESQRLLLATKVLRERLATDPVHDRIIIFTSMVTQIRKLLSKLNTAPAPTTYNVKPQNFLEFVRHHGFRVTGSETCRPRQRICNSLAKFRSIDGSCNNFAKPSWGRANIALLRVLPARYSDDIHALPLSASGEEPLPNARQVSSQLFARRTDAFESQLTLAVAQWGQIVAHDMARQVADQTVDGGIECCANKRVPLSNWEQHYSCAPIVNERNCMNFVRSMTIAREDCSIGPANQLNAVSSYMDLSPLYGADEATSVRLRAYQGGLLSYEVRANRLMPSSSVRSGSCDADDVCYQTGDTRGNQDPQLAMMLTLLIREHTRLAYELATINSHWDDERLFQESRRIVIAEYQHITYRYWLPLVIGKRYCKDHKICPANNNLSHAYSEKINPSTINGFTTGAFRFLHSLVEGNISLVTENNSSSQTLRLSDYYFRPGILESDFNFESLLRGLVQQRMQKADSNFHPEISQYLFRSASEFGMDLQALDIQRARDHGIPGYNAYRQICGLESAKDFHELINEISLTNIEKLQHVYKHVNDIDLLVGITMENRMPGSLVGPTGRCLIGEQFYRSRVGDKYFYNNANFPHSFTPGQFEEIKKGSLAVMICDLGQAVSAIQKNPFKVASGKNTVRCSNLPRINLELWREEIET